MLLRCVAKIFALEPKATSIETGIIAALILSAFVSALLAMSDPLNDLYSSMFGVTTIVGAR